MTEKIEFTGRLSSIRYQDTTSGFLIGVFAGRWTGENATEAILQLGDTSITAKGVMLNPQQGLTYKLKIKEAPANKYGRQYVIHEYETIVPMDPHGIFKYITRVCRFVGPAIGGKIVDLYGRETIRIMKDDPERIAREVPGVTLERAIEIQETLRENEENERVMVELEGLLDVQGMRKDLPMTLIKDHKSNAAEIVKRDPYILTQYHGIGFILADQVAIQKVGYDPAGMKRVKAAVTHVIKEEMATAGSTWISGRIIEKRIAELIQATKEGIDTALSQLKEDRIITDTTMFLDGIRTTLWAFTWIDRFETEIAQRISSFGRIKNDNHHTDKPAASRC